MDAVTRGMTMHLSDTPSDRTHVEVALPDDTFSVAAYESMKGDIPALDDHRAAKVSLRFSGSASLDHTSRDDLELLKALRLGHDLRLIVLGSPASKTYSIDPSGETLSFSCALRVVAIEGAESA